MLSCMGPDSSPAQACVCWVLLAVAELTWGQLLKHLGDLFQRGIWTPQEGSRVG